MVAHDVDYYQAILIYKMAIQEHPNLWKDMIYGSVLSSPLKALYTSPTGRLARY